MAAGIPQLIDISPTNCLDLDEKRAVEIFLGKNQEQARKLFQENSVHYTDYLHSMGSVAFRYYFPALLGYIRTTDAKKDPGVLHSLVTVLEIRFSCRSDARESFAGIRNETEETLDHCLAHFQEFDGDEQIYGKLKEQIQNWRSRLTGC